MFYYLIMYGLSLLIFVATISGNCRAEDFIIAIDIGHTINSPGATSARGVPEYLFNQNIGTLLYQQLQQDMRFKRSFIINETGDDISLPPEPRSPINGGRISWSLSIMIPWSPRICLNGFAREEFCPIAISSPDIPSFIRKKTAVPSTA